MSHQKMKGYVKLAKKAKKVLKSSKQILQGVRSLIKLVKG